MARRTWVQVVGTGDLHDLARDLRRAGGEDVTDRLRRGLREAARPLAPLARSAILSMPSKGQNARRGKPSTRAQMARAVTTSVRLTGKSPRVGVYVAPRKMPSGKWSLPGYFERVPGKERLRHPVFGNPNVWVAQQVPPDGFFTKSVRSTERDVQRAANRVIDQIAREIEG